MLVPPSTVPAIPPSATAQGKPARSLRGQPVDSRPNSPRKISHRLQAVAISGEQGKA